MKSLATILVLLATSASYVVSLPTEGNIPRGPGNHLQNLPLYARESKHNSGKSKGSAASNVTTDANNSTENANTGKKNGKKGTKGQENNNNSTAVNNGTDVNTGDGKGEGNGKGKGNAQDLLGQLIADLEAKLGVDLGQNNQVDQNGQVDVADLLKLLGARDESANAPVARGTDRSSD
jgi:hypothetical protein